MNSTDNLNSMEDESQDQRPRQQSLGGVLRREGNWKCLLLSALLAGCLAAAAWCRLAQVQRVVINFSVYPIKRTRQMSPCDDGYIYIPVAFMGLLYLVYLVECYHCTARLQLAHRVDVSHVADRVRAMRMAKPKVWWKAVCYHYVRRKRQITRYRNGDAYTTTQVYYERVNSHSASATFGHAYCGFKDVSRNLILDSKGPITKIRFSKGFAFSNIEAAGEFEDQRSRFFAQHERYDMYMEMREGLDLVGVSSFKEYMVAYRDTDRLAWYSSQTLFWVLSCLLLSWPLRILIECNTSYVHYTVTKVFGGNYDADITRRLDLEAHISPYTPPVARLSRLDATASITSPQTAILANPVGMDSTNNFSQQINILALARNRNGVDRSEVMSHTSTIDSLELFATIRENCVLVPSYSEALLLASSADNQDEMETILEDATQSIDETLCRQSNVSNSNIVYSRSLHNIVPENSSRGSCNRYLSSMSLSNRQSQNSLPSTSTIHNINYIQENSNGIDIASTNLQTDNDTHECRNSNDQINIKSAIINNSVDTPRKTIRIMEKFDIDKNKRSSHVIDIENSVIFNGSNECFVGHHKYSTNNNKIHATQSNYSLKTVNFNGVNSRRGSTVIVDKFKAQNRRSWAGFLPKPNSSFYNHNRIHGARIRPIANMSNRRNSMSERLIKNVDDVTPLNESLQECENSNERLEANNEDNARISEESIPSAQIESIERNLRARSNSDSICRGALYFASPLLQTCPSDPFGGRDLTTPTEDPPPYEVAINLPVLRRITRSVTDRGELFGQSRAFIMDTLLNRRSCADNIVSGVDSMRLLQQNGTSTNETPEMETIL